MCKYCKTISPSVTHFIYYLFVPLAYHSNFLFDECLSVKVTDAAEDITPIQSDEGPGAMTQLAKRVNLENKYYSELFY